MALEYIHESKITHRDLKPENILMFANLRVKVCDFGLSREAQSSIETISRCGTPKFAAPEVMQTIQGYEPKPFLPDIFSFGLTLCYMMIKDIPSMADIVKQQINFPFEYSQ